MRVMLKTFLTSIPDRSKAIASDSSRMRFLKNSLVGSALAFLRDLFGTVGLRRRVAEHNVRIQHTHPAL